MHIRLSVPFFIVIFVAFVFGVSVFSCHQREKEHYGSTELIIARYANNDGKPLIGKDGVSWWKVESFHVSIDDLKRIYVLDIYRSKILQYSSDGVLAREINLKDTTFPYTDCNIDDGYMDYRIVVSKDGSYFYVMTDESKWTVFDSSGVPRRQKQIIPTTISLNRQCDDKLITDYEIMDAEFNVLSQRKRRHNIQIDYPISEEVVVNYDTSVFENRRYLSKMNASGKVYWERKVDGDRCILDIIGVDGNGNIYLLVNEPFGIVKIDKNGRLIARVTLPKEALNYTTNGGTRGTYQVLCDGTIYYIPPMLFNHDSDYYGFISKGVRSVYKIERTQ